MADSALLKVDRAAKHVDEISELFRKKRPFAYVVETNTETRERATRTKKNVAVINDAAVICGDVVHTLRSALDHAFWEIVSPRCSTDAQLRALQFPTSSKANRLDRAIQDRFAHLAGTGFYCALRNLKPHGESGGHELLHLLHELDVLDKHKLLIPTADYKVLGSDMLRRQIPDFPRDLNLTNVVIGGSRRDIVWEISEFISPEQLGKVQAPTMHIFHREIDVPVEIVFENGPLGNHRPVIHTLNEFVDTIRRIIKLMREAANSY